MIGARSKVLNRMRTVRQVSRRLFLLGLLVTALSACPGRSHAQEAPAVAGSAAQVSGREGTPAAQSPEKNKQEKDENEAYKHSDVVKLLGSKLGLSTEQAATVFELTNFIILAVLLAWLLIKTLPKSFRERTGAIQKRLVDARAATEEANARLSSVEGRLSQLDGRIAAMRSQAETDLAAEEQRVRAAIEDERKKILAAAEQEIAAATAQAHRQIQQYAAELAVDQAAKKLVVSAETDRLLVQEFANRLTGKRGGEN